MSFQDLFSAQADMYAKHRPRYPAFLFDYLASLVSEREVAWDCATGNGQAALDLTRYFKQVVATDISEAQIQHATQHDQIVYRVAPAEDSGLPDQSVNMVVVAQALHWFDFIPFYTEVRRVLRPKGIIAAFGYHFAEINTEIDLILQDYAHRTLDEHWSPQNRLLWNNYQEIPFPFQRIHAPAFTIETRWDMLGLMGYLRSWSSTQSYIEMHGHSPLEALWEQLLPVWGNPDIKRHVQWRLVLLVGRNTFEQHYIAEKGLSSSS